MKEYKVGSLFAGVGGICLGFQNAKTEGACYRLVWANEIDEYACTTYRTNFSHMLLEGDIKKVLHPELIDQEIIDAKKAYEEAIKDKEVNRDREEVIDQKIVDAKKSYEKANKDAEIKLEVLSQLQSNRDSEYEKYTRFHEQILSEPIDVLNGGFPCQAFSIAGEQKGFEDERGNLFLYIVDLIEKLGEKFYKPRILFLENVKNLQSHDDGRTYKVIKKKLEDCGYLICEKVLNTMDYTDLPQNRERIYIIGFLNEEDAKRFEIFTSERLSQLRKVKTSVDRAEDVKKVIDYSLTLAKGEKYYYTRKKYPHYFVTQEEFEESHKGKGIRINLQEQIDEMYQFYQCRRGMYVRKNKSDVCPTLTANMGTGGHNVPLIKVTDGVRKLTPAETFKLQGFPVGDGYELPIMHKGKAYLDAQLYKQAGNAVSVPVITMLVTEILRIIE